MLGIPEGPPAPAPIRWLSNFLDALILLMGTCMVGIVFFNILNRIFQFNVAMTTELCEFMMTWVTFLGGAAASRRGIHMTITEFIDKLDEKKRFLADALVQIFCAVVLTVCIWYGISIVNMNKENLLTVLGWSKAWQYMGLPVGFSFALIFTLFDIYQIMRGVSRSERYGAGE